MAEQVAGRARVLVVEDDATLRRVAEYRLSEAGYEVRVAADGGAGLAAFEESAPDVVLTDLRMPALDGESLYAQVLARDPSVAVIVMTGHGTVEGAVRALKAGVAHYLTKPLSWDETLVVVEKEVARRALARENARLRDALKSRFAIDGLVGASPALRAVQETVARLVDADATVLVQGESGTGKELVARALHFQGRRAGGPFVAVNCAAIPKDLVASELFGHVAGAFSGATRDHRGYFEQAHGGTLFLDEVAEIPVPVQATLLRVLAERRVRRLGAEDTVGVNVRVVAATNRDLEEAVEEGDFRRDLYYRIAVVPLRLPALRERGDDVLLLARHFASSAAERPVQFTPAAERALVRHAWPGNVRELENVVSRAVLLARDSGVVDADDLHLPQPVKRVDALVREFPAGGVDLAQLERACIRRALEHTAGNQSRAARLLGISRHALIYRMQKHGLAGRDDAGAAAEPGAAEQ